MYRLSCAPWGGAQHDAATGELREAVVLNKETALADLEKLFYPREAELAHSLPPPGLEETLEDSDPSMDISPVDRASAGAGRSRASTPVLLRRMAVPPHAQIASPPTTHDSWRTDRASELGLNEGGRRSASPRRGVRVPEGSSNLTMPDPSRIRRSDIATPSSANWGQRFRLFQACFVPLLAQLSPRPYPRFEDEFFDLAWEEQFVQYGYLRIPDDADRVRVILWLETQDFSGPRQLLHLCLAAGIRIHLGYRTDAPLPNNAKEIAGPIPEHHESEYLSFGDGGTELYASYRGMVQDLCRRECAPSFLCYSGFVSAIAAKYGRDIIKDRLKEGLSLPARFHKLGQVEHPYGVYPEVLVERPPPRDVNKLLGMVIGKDGNKKYWLYPPPPLWESLWPGNGEWNHKEEQYFLDLYAGWEKGARSPWSMKRWKDHLEGLAHKMRGLHPDRVAPSMSVRTARDWAILFDLVYGVKDATIALRDLGSSFRAQKLPLFR